MKTAILHVISLARVALVAARGRAAQSRKSHVRLRAELAEARREISLLEEELRLKDLRMGCVKPRRRPHYRSTERLAILELRAARGWNTAQTASRFHLQPATVTDWMRRVDEGGERALVQTPEPVNRFPDLVRYIVRRLETLCPTMGKKRIAQTLARAGLELGVTTVGRMLKEREGRRPKSEDAAVDAESVGNTGEPTPVRAKGPNDIWQLDLTVVPTARGFWTAWFPFSIVQAWPFSWWVACVVDHYSRRVLGFAVFPKEPKSIDIRRFLGGIAGKIGATPKYIVTDKGGQFDCPGFRAWCKSRGILPRYGSTASLYATTIVERFFRSLKQEWLRRIQVALRHEAMRREVATYLGWYEKHRPHQGLDGLTPKEVYEGKSSDTSGEATTDWKRPLTLVVRFHEGRRQLPIVELKKAA